MCSIDLQNVKNRLFQRVRLTLWSCESAARWNKRIDRILGKALMPEGSQVCCVWSAVWNITHATEAPSVPACPRTPHIFESQLLLDVAKKCFSKFHCFLLQCLGCLIQFRISHFWPEHLWTTKRRPKLASLDISTSKHRPVSLLIIGPFCIQNKYKSNTNSSW